MYAWLLLASNVRASVPAVVFAALLLPVTSCATQKDEVDPKSAPASQGIQAETPDEKRLLAAVQRYNDAFHTGDYESVYRMQVDLCRNLSFEDGLSMQVKQSATRYGEPQNITSFKAKFDQKLAFVTYTFEDRRLNRRGEAWVLDSNGWRYADC